MKLKMLAAAIALACAPAAFATTSLGTLSSTAKSISTTGAVFYTDYTFSIGSSNSSLSGTFGGSFFDFGGSISLYNSNGLLLMYDSSPNSISFSGLNSGSYKLALSGYNLFGTTVTGSLSATSNVAAPVPEAENYAMLAVGLSGVGLIGLRKSRRRA